MTESQLSFNSRLKNMWQSLVRRSLESAKFLVLLLVLGAGTLVVFGWLLSIHWSFGFLLIAVYGLQIRDPNPQRLKLSQKIGAMALLVCISGAIFATMSFMIVSIKAGSYLGASEVTFFHVLLYYGWLSLDLVPAIDATKTLGIGPPIEHRGIVAALPVALYKGFVVLVLFKAIKDWLTEKPPANNSSPSSESAQQIVGRERQERTKTGPARVE